MGKKKNELDKYKHLGTKMTATMTFKEDPAVKEEFFEFCRKNDLKSGMILRDLLHTFLEDVRV